MIRFLLVLVVILTAQITIAQELPDSVLACYNSAKDPSEKGRCLSNYLIGLSIPPIEQVSKSMQLQAYFLKRKDSVGYDYARLNLARNLEWISDYQHALKIEYELLPRFEKADDPYGLMRTLNGIGNAMDNSQNHEKAIYYYKKGLPLAIRMGDKTHYAYALNNIANVYSKMGLPDSALVNAQKAVAMSKEIDDPSFYAYAITSLGEGYMAQGDHDIARPFLRKGYEEAKRYKDWYAAGYACNDLSESFLATQQLDSSKYYAHQALAQFTLASNIEQMLRSYQCLLRSFQPSNQKDSIFKYFQLVMTAKDTLFSLSKTRDVEAMHFQEQIRQLELENEEEFEAVERKHNIQYAAIALSFLILATLFILLSRSIIISEKWVSYIGVFGVLAVFEFIDLYLHPYLADLTHHSPILMLLILIVLASVLIPIHHRIEKYVKVKMVEKNKKVRLQAARRTIERLEKEVD